MVNKKLWSAGRLHLPEVNIVRVGSNSYSRYTLMIAIFFQLHVVLLVFLQLSMIPVMRSTTIFLFEILFA